MHQKKQTVIIGAGASGMIAAIEAARYGTDVMLIEKEKRAGKKLLATGNGRCNFSNMNSSLPYYHGKNLILAESVLKKVTLEEVLSLFSHLGIKYKVEEEGKIYPYSDQGSSVLDVIRYEMERLGVEIRTETKAVCINQKEHGFGVMLEGKEIKETIEANKVILATGGKAGSKFGADGSGYQLATQLGHRLIKPLPAIVQLKLKAPWLKALNGVKWQGAVSITQQKEILRREEGEILFTEYGISGPPALQLGRLASEKGENCNVSISLFPEWSRDELCAEVYMRMRSSQEKPADFSLVGLLHKKMIPVILKESGIIKTDCLVSEVTDIQLKQLINLLSNWVIPVKGTLSWQHAQVTAGGIDTTEIRTDTLESKLVKGLYLTGEMMDIDGDCGGYNLHWAWCTGIIAGRSSALA
ncbi:BaiN/RdsA family NAD(P)/FAD-dependent oxidoreductase [Tindallia californiensis]|uniref:Flavoprotein, HI0933 family n=1 Tax=Tindallia californiensis TaxID=159292 RepID=A0A1H3J5S4_9FIRM|nr:NAD(P)/FAD-dependent oxidoreductase [Tindallia californiensis]SDY34798.1 hypothetical protein SAMN05192546_101414 [Tindallia californiensis]